MNQNGSEDVLQRDLNLSRGIRLTGNEAERRAVRVAIGPAPVRVVQHVESLDTELQFMSFGDGEVLAQTDVEIPDAGAAQAVARLEAEGPRRRSHPDGVLTRSATSRLTVAQLHTWVEPGRRFGEVCPLCAGVSG